MQVLINEQMFRFKHTDTERKKHAVQMSHYSLDNVFLDKYKLQSYKSEHSTSNVGLTAEPQLS